jgi:hypothetical protein
MKEDKQSQQKPAAEVVGVTPMPEEGIRKFIASNAASTAI